MTTEKREQVFISSTFRDLQEERRIVTQTLLQADAIPAGMELFPASDSQKFDLIKRVIDLCDYYVVIVGGRYGSVDAEQELSYTEMEYDYAVEQSIPVMAFLHGNPGNLPSDQTELDPELRAKLQAFRDKLETRMVVYWQNGQDLAGQVALSLMNTRKSHPAVGWVRGNQAMTPEVQAELVELRAKVRELTADLNEEKRQHTAGIDPNELSQGDERAGITAQSTCRFEASPQYPYSHEAVEITNTSRHSWNEILRVIGPTLMEEASARQMKSVLSRMCYRAACEDLLYRADEEGNVIAEVEDTRILPESFDDIKVQFNALGLIEKGETSRQAHDRNVYWKLTDKGHQHLIQIHAIRRETSDAVDEEEREPATSE